MSIITYPLNGITYDATDAETYLCTRTSGVFSAENNFNYSLTGDLQITIAAGIAWIRNANYKGKSVCNTAPAALSIPLGDSYNPRIDRIVLEYSAANNLTALKVIQGTPAAAPTAPPVIQTEIVYQLGLYTVYVDRAATAITAADVTDTRLDETVCGVMRDGVTGIPTAELQAQFMGWFDYVREFFTQEDVSANSLTLEGHPASYFLPATGTAQDSDALGGILASDYSPKPDVSTTLPPSGTALENNTIYNISAPVSNYTFTAPGAGGWAHGRFTVGSNITFSPAVSLNNTLTLIGGETYEFDVYDGVWAVAAVK